MQKSDRLGFQRTLNGCDEELHKMRYKCLLGPTVEDESVSRGLITKKIV